MKNKTQIRIFVSLLLTFCLLAVPMTALAKKGEKNFKKGLQYEAAQQWEKAAQEFTLAVAADPSNVEYQLHFRRASFNASQAYMQQGRALAEQQDYIGAYNAFRQAYGYDPVNSLAVSEMERMLRLQSVKDGTNGTVNGEGNNSNGELPEGGTLTPTASQDPSLPPGRTEQLRVISYSGDLKAFIRSLAEQLSLNVVFDRQSFAQQRTIDLNLRDVTTAQALDYVFLQEGLFFQKLSRRTILVADQTRRPQYQQLVLRTFFLSNIDPTEARQLVTQAIPPSVGRPQTIVVPDKATNSLTVRDTAENVRLIGELLRSIDKDRAEVVMDVNIYEVSKNDLLQFGNQFGSGNFNLGGSPGLSILTSNAARSSLDTGVNVASIIGGVPTAAAAALVLPPSVLTAIQSKDNTRLIASTQVHAFNGEESTARIGQRVPVQTAQAYPFGVQTGTTTNPTTGFPSGGFPVINYEPTGLTLKFTPQVFPNLDVQVKMSIESKDVLGAGTLTPTFTERTITGTARVQNNRTMMLASVSQDVQTSGRRGLPVLGLIPVLGRLFTSPTRDNRQVDIVIAVTPKVLRAPAVTPRDEEMRPSGTLSAPTTGSLEAMIRDSDREEALAAARRLPRNAVVEVRDSEPAPFSPGARLVETVASFNATKQLLLPTATTSGVASDTQAKAVKPQPQTEELPEYVPAPKSLVSDRSANEVAAVNPTGNGAANAVLTSMPHAIDAAVSPKLARTATLSLPALETINVGQKRQVALALDSKTPLSLAVVTLRFDPKVVKVNSISAGTLFSSGNGKAPSVTQSIDPSGVCIISVSTLNGTVPMVGNGTLLLIEVEGIAPGDALLNLEKQTMHLVATDARDVVLEVKQGRTAVKP
ncbi:MAG TPA: secretin N-terminal domain-containing protein [Pyrinomonadaceae bacterium]|nr:secretin N-terminal domain-containing protein [Pyrinomonadaceae bacterium]